MLDRFEREVVYNVNGKEPVHEITRWDFNKSCCTCEVELDMEYPRRGNALSTRIKITMLDMTKPEVFFMGDIENSYRSEHAFEMRINGAWEADVLGEVFLSLGKKLLSSPEGSALE